MTPDRRPRRLRLRPLPDREALVSGLLSLSAELAAETPLAERMTRVCRTTAELLGCDRSSLFLKDGEHYRARFNHGTPDIERVFLQHRVRSDDPLVAECMRRRGFVTMHDAKRSPLMDRRTAVAARIRSIVAAPLLAPDAAPLGFLTAEFNERKGRFGRVPSALVERLAGLAAVVLEVERARDAHRDAEQEASRLAERIRRLERSDSLAQHGSSRAPFGGEPGGRGDAVQPPADRGEPA